MTKHQKNFLLGFFENKEFPGWKTIATSLIEHGNTIVAGDECIWKGGIGNFIQTEPAQNAFGCLLYKFDKESFYKSVYYQEILSHNLKVLSNKKREIIEEYNDLKEMYKT